MHCVIRSLRPQKRSCYARYRLRHRPDHLACTARPFSHSVPSSNGLPDSVIIPAARPVIAATMVTRRLEKLQPPQPNAQHNQNPANAHAPAASCNRPLMGAPASACDTASYKSFVSQTAIRVHDMCVDAVICMRGAVRRLLNRAQPSMHERLRRVVTPPEAKTNCCEVLLARQV